MLEQLKDVLKEYGLNENAATVYLTTLQIWSWSAATIARISKIKRVTTYAILQELVRKRVIREITKDGVKVFSAVEPEQILTNKQQECERFEKLLPMFADVRDKYWNKPKVEYLDGLSGLKKYYDKQIQWRANIFAFLSVQHAHKELVDYLYTVHVPQRIEAWIFAHVLVPKLKENEQYVWLDKSSNRETVMIDHPLFNAASEIDLFAWDKVGFAMFAENEMSATIIQSSHLYQTLKSIFDLLWSMYYDEWKS